MDAVRVRQLGMLPYESAFSQMVQFTQQRTAQTPDEIWLVEHPPVYTLGKAADSANVLSAGLIPVIETDRGGDVTYHGPGQAVVYLLLDLKRRFNRLWVHRLVTQIEEAVIQVLALHQIHGERRSGAPGVYIPSHQDAKIAALGLKVMWRGCTYHGVALNVDMDLSPFHAINPCGYAGLMVTDMKTEGVICQVPEIQHDLVRSLADTVGFSIEEGEDD